MNNDVLKKYLHEEAKITTSGELATYEVLPAEIIEVCRRLYIEHRLPLKILTAFDERKETGFFKVMYVFGIPESHGFIAPYIKVKDAFPSLTPSIHEASLYERKILTFFGLRPEGHPDPRPFVLHENWPNSVFPLRKNFDVHDRPATAKGEYPFRKIEGEGIYEIPVGPVHAGIIEPGHFRFSVAGEEIILLEPRLGYSHKGSEKLFETLPLKEKIRLSERISGDSSFSHSLAFCQALEALSDTAPSDRVLYLRLIFCELERIANHLGDIGLIMQDTGFNFGGSQGARLKETVMRLNDELTGSRFLRGVNTVGGATKDYTADAEETLFEALSALEKDFSEVIEVAENSSSLINRLKETGVLTGEIAKDHGAVGVPARATGFSVDARIDYPYAAYTNCKPVIALEQSGDVYGRFSVRVQEVRTSINLIKKALRETPRAGSTRSLEPNLVFKKNSYAVGIVEGWRGDIVYLVSTDSEGKLSRVAVRDPSFLNWSLLSRSAKGNMVPDFPLINKSFNLSYSGNDL